MTDHTSDNKRVAKNTLALYFRMFITMAVALFTSRVVLKTLGVSDYGVYSVVGGFVSMIAYINSMFVGATQRFLAFSIGKGEEKQLSNVFTTSIRLQLIIGLIVLVIAETFGLWFVNNKLVIEPQRIIAANWVYQCSVISLLVSVVSVPFNACIIAHERLHIYAYVSILDVILKLVIVYLLVVIPSDKLVVYGILHLVVSTIVAFIYFIYCKNSFLECRTLGKFDKVLSKEMFAYSSWSMLGTLCFSFKDQFSNMMQNMFFGTTVNAARGIALQVNGAINSFAGNFFMAINPQVTKQYAAGDKEQFRKLTYFSSRFAFYLMMVLIIPVIINVDYILKLWLDVVPEYTGIFVQITLLTSLIYSITSSSTAAIQAIGKVKVFQIGITIILLSELPVAYILLKMGYEPYYALLPGIITQFLGVIYRFIVLKHLEPTFSYREYFFGTVLKCGVVFILCFISSWLVTRLKEIDFVWFVFNVFIVTVINISIVFFIGLSTTERRLVIKLISTKLPLLKK